MKFKNTLSQWIDGKSEFPENQEGKETFEKIKFYSAQLQAPDFDKKGVYEKIKIANEQKINHRHSNYTFLLKIAAIFIIAFGVLTYLYQSNSFTYQTSLAETQSLNLPDNSQVLLQPGSTLNYNAFTWFLNRNVNLSGEAFFDVEKGKTFSVKTNTGEVEVLGTKFNVKTTSDKLNVVCYEGRVKVSQNQVSEIINLNEYVIIKDNKVLKKNSITLNNLPTQTKYFQIVDNEFGELIKDVERYYGININTENLRISKHFTGKLPKNDVKKALEIISKTFQLKLKTTNENNYIFVEDASQ